MAVYSELLEGKLRTGSTELLQNCALQLWFDVKYLTALLTASERPADKVMTLFVLPKCLACVSCGQITSSEGGAWSLGTE